MQLENNLQVCELFDLYGGLLTPHQQKIIKAYYYQNLSLGEIAKNNNITRQAIYDTIKKAISILENFEKKLALSEKYSEIKNNLQSDKELENIILNILYR